MLFTSEYNCKKGKRLLFVKVHGSRKEEKKSTKCSLGQFVFYAQENNFPSLPTTWLIRMNFNFLVIVPIFFSFMKVKLMKMLLLISLKCSSTFIIIHFIRLKEIFSSYRNFCCYNDKIKLIFCLIKISHFVRL